MNKPATQGKRISTLPRMPHTPTSPASTSIEGKAAFKEGEHVGGEIGHFGEDAAHDAGVIVDKLGRKFNPMLHPRDARGRFIETGGVVREFGGGVGKVLKMLPDGKVEVQRADGTISDDLPNRLTMIARPDGSLPTANHFKVMAEDAARLAGQGARGGMGSDGRGDGLNTRDFGGINLDHPGLAERAAQHSKPFGKLAEVEQKFARGDVGNVKDGETAEARAARVADTQKRIAGLKSKQLTPDGNFIVGRGQSGGYSVYHTGTGQRVGGVYGSKGEAARVAEHLGDLQVNGEKFDWSSPDLYKRLNPDVHAAIDEAGRAGREQHEALAPFEQQQKAVKASAKDLKPVANAGFANTAELRAHLRDSFAESAGQDPDSKAAKHAASMRKLADDPTLELLPGGLMLNTRTSDEGKTFQLSDARTGLSLGAHGQAKTRAEAVKLAKAYTDVRDKDGNALDWTADDLNNRIAGFRDHNGKRIGDAVRSYLDGERHPNLTPNKAKSSLGKAERDPKQELDATWEKGFEDANPLELRNALEASEQKLASLPDGDPDKALYTRRIRFLKSKLRGDGLDPDNDRRDEPSFSVANGPRAKELAAERAANVGKPGFDEDGNFIPIRGNAATGPANLDDRNAARRSASDVVRTFGVHGDRDAQDEAQRKLDALDVVNNGRRHSAGDRAMAAGEAAHALDKLHDSIPNTGMEHHEQARDAVKAAKRDLIDAHKTTSAVSSDAAALHTDTTPNPEGQHGLRPDSAAPLADISPDGVRESERPGHVLPEPRSEGGRTDLGADGRAAGEGAGADRRGPGAADHDSTVDRGGDRVEGRGVPATGAGRGGQRAAQLDQTGPDAARRGEALPNEGATDLPGKAPVGDPVVSAAPAAEKFVPKSQVDLSPTGKKAKAQANLAAIKLALQLRDEHRAPNEAERRVLARFSSWGALPGMFDPNNDEFAPERAELEKLLTPDELEAARDTTINAHYTDAHMVQSMWGAMDQLGLDSKSTVLEPGSGIGNFLHFAPEGVQMIGVEKDPTTAALSQALHPDAHIENLPFEKAKIAPGSIDAVIGNVPFSEIRPAEDNPGNHVLHDMFILKSLRSLKPGGVAILMTSAGTLDKKDSKARAAMNEHADFLGAVRLPRGAHRAAAGTEVMTDVLVFRKRADGERPRGQKFVGLRAITGADGVEHQVNSYFADHPEHMLGNVTSVKSMYGDHVELGVVSDDLSQVPEQMQTALRNIVQSAKDRDLGFDTSAAPHTAADAIGRLEAHAGGMPGESHIVDHGDGTFSQWQNGALVPLQVPKARVKEVSALLKLRDLRQALLAEERGNTEDTPLMGKLRADLNTAYDAYTKKYGPILRSKFVRVGGTDPVTGEPRTRRKREIPDAFRRDRLGSAVVDALEEYNPDTGVAKKTDIFAQRVIKPAIPVTHADSPEDALALVLNDGADVNLDKVASLMGLPDAAAARKALGNLVFDDPATGEVVDRATYLRGNVRTKLAEARAMAEVDPKYAPNVTELEKALPPDWRVDQIQAHPGAPWLPTDTLQDYVRERFNAPNATVSNPGGGTGWEVTVPVTMDNADIVTQKYGVPTARSWDAGAIFKAVIQQSPIVVRHEDPQTGKSYVDAAETMQANRIAGEMLADFRQWLFADPERADRLASLYNDKFNFLADVSYVGRKVTVPGLVETRSLRANQHEGISRIVSEPTTLLAHEVGFGKTMTMQGASLKLRQLGLANKPAHVVPNHMLEQYAREFLRDFPDAKILVATKNDLAGSGAADTAKKREAFVARAASGDWDAIIFTHSAFELIPMSPDAQEAYLNNEVSHMRAELEARLAAGGDDAPGVKRLVKQLNAYEERIKKQIQTQRDKGGVNFEDTGIDYLFVDEAHLFKNLMTQSRIEGASIAGSKRAQDIHMKLQHLRATRGDNARIGTFATATPVSNSMTEVYTMQRFMRPDLLKETGTEQFDRWAAQFGEVVAKPEVDPTGMSFRNKARFRKFRNVPEMLRQYRAFTDVRLAEDATFERPDLNDGSAKTIMVKPSAAQADYLQNEIKARAEKLAAGGVDPKEDNALKLSGDGRKAALDMRLVGRDDPESPKIEAAADQITSIYQREKDKQYFRGPNSDELHETPGSLQLVFLDLGTPKDPTPPSVNKIADRVTPLQQLVSAGHMTRDTARLRLVEALGKSKRDDIEAVAEALGIDTANEYDEDSTKGEIVADVIDRLVPTGGEMQPIETVAYDPSNPPWSAYQHLKDELIKRGVPADGIRFMHEAKNDEQKAQLFDQARTGGVSVLIGSTQKMGVGTNVQDRAVALHHLDVPWRPADLQQRDGRIIRSGNQNSAVDIYRYVTEGTFDSYMWQGIARKQSFINPVMKGDMSIREIEDLSSDELELGEIVALSSGNPWLMRKAQTDAKKAELAAEATAHATQVEQARRAIGRYDAEAQVAASNIPALQEAASKVEDTSGDKFSATIGGHTTDERAAADTSLKLALTKLYQANKGSRPSEWEQIGSMAGLPLVARYNTKGSDRWMEVALGGIESRAQMVELADLDPKSSIRPLARLENTAKVLPHTIEQEQRKANAAREAAKRARETAEKPFTKTRELEQARQHADLVDAIIEHTSHGQLGEDQQAVLDALIAREHELSGVNAKKEANSGLLVVQPEKPLAPEMLPDSAELARIVQRQDKAKAGADRGWQRQSEQLADELGAGGELSEDSDVVDAVSRVMHGRDPEATDDDVKRHVAKYLSDKRAAQAAAEGKPAPAPVEDHTDTPALQEPVNAPVAEARERDSQAGDPVTAAAPADAPQEPADLEADRQQADESSIDDLVESLGEDAGQPQPASEAVESALDAYKAEPTAENLQQVNDAAAVTPEPQAAEATPAEAEVEGQNSTETGTDLPEPQAAETPAPQATVRPGPLAKREAEYLLETHEDSGTSPGYTMDDKGQLQVHDLDTAIKELGAQRDFADADASNAMDAEERREHVRRRAALGTLVTKLQAEKDRRDNTGDDTAARPVAEPVDETPVQAPAVTKTPAAPRAEAPAAEPSEPAEATPRAPRQPSALQQEYQQAREEQDRRFEDHVGGGISASDTHTPEYQQYFGLGEHAGAGTEQRVNFRDFLKQRSQGAEHDRRLQDAYDSGSALGQRHALDANSDLHDDEYERASAGHDEGAFASGYSDGLVAGDRRAEQITAATPQVHQIASDLADQVRDSDPTLAEAIDQARATHADDPQGLIDTLGDYAHRAERGARYAHQAMLDSRAEAARTQREGAQKRTTDQHIAAAAAREATSARMHDSAQKLRDAARRAQNALGPRAEKPLSTFEQNAAEQLNLTDLAQRPDIAGMHYDDLEREGDKLRQAVDTLGNVPDGKADQLTNRVRNRLFDIDGEMSNRDAEAAKGTYRLPGGWSLLNYSDPDGGDGTANVIDENGNHVGTVEARMTPKGARWKPFPPKFRPDGSPAPAPKREWPHDYPTAQQAADAVRALRDSRRAKDAQLEPAHEPAAAEHEADTAAANEVPSAGSLPAKTAKQHGLKDGDRAYVADSIGTVRPGTMHVSRSGISFTPDDERVPGFGLGGVASKIRAQKIETPEPVKAAEAAETVEPEMPAELSPDAVHVVPDDAKVIESFDTGHELVDAGDGQAAIRDEDGNIEAVGPKAEMDAYATTFTPEHQVESFDGSVVSDDALRDAVADAEHADTPTEAQHAEDESRGIAETIDNPPVAETQDTPDVVEDMPIEQVAPADTIGQGDTPKPAEKAELAKAADADESMPADFAGEWYAKALDGEDFDPTPQQAAIYRDLLAKKNLVVVAKAGTGKTTTLEGAARRMAIEHPGAKIGYGCFNASTAQEAVRRMPDNTDAVSTHGLAMRWSDAAHPKGEGWRARRDRPGLVKLPELRDYYGVREDVRGPGGVVMSPTEQVAAAKNAVDTWATSADDKISLKHFGGSLDELDDAGKKRVIDLAHRMWADISDLKNGKQKATFDHARKAWALARPDFSKPGFGFKHPLDVLFVDEAQDSAPVWAKVIADQTIPKVVVGDPDQAINGFTGAIDYLDKAAENADSILPLSKSFRYGPHIAGVGNRFLTLLNSRTRGIGAGPDGQILEPGTMQHADAVLTRTNAGMLGEVARELADGRVVSLTKGTKNDLLNVVDTARWLQGIGDRPAKIAEDLEAFDTWGQFEKAAEKGDDPKLSSLKRVIDQYGIDGLADLVSQTVEGQGGALSDVDFDRGDKQMVLSGRGTYAMANAVKAARGGRSLHGYKVDGGTWKFNGADKTWAFHGTPEQQDAALDDLRRMLGVQKPDVTISTAHKAKGLEWDRVRIGDDFKGPQVDPQTDTKTMPSKDELMLAYVAATRAKRDLDPGSLSWVFDETDDADEAPFVKDDRVPLAAADTATSDAQGALDQVNAANEAYKTDPSEENLQALMDASRAAVEASQAAPAEPAAPRVPKPATTGPQQAVLQDVLNDLHRLANPHGGASQVGYKRQVVAKLLDGGYLVRTDSRNPDMDGGRYRLHLTQKGADELRAWAAYNRDTDMPGGEDPNLDDIPLHPGMAAAEAPEDAESTDGLLPIDLATPTHADEAAEVAAPAEDAEADTSTEAPAPAPAAEPAAPAAPSPEQLALEDELYGDVEPGEDDNYSNLHDRAEASMQTQDGVDFFADPARDDENPGDLAVAADAHADKLDELADEREADAADETLPQEERDQAADHAQALRDDAEVMRKTAEIAKKYAAKQKAHRKAGTSKGHKLHRGPRWHADRPIHSLLPHVLRRHEHLRHLDRLRDVARPDRLGDIARGGPLDMLRHFGHGNLFGKDPKAPTGKFWNALLDNHIHTPKGTLEGTHASPIPHFGKPEQAGGFYDAVAHVAEHGTLATSDGTDLPAPHGAQEQAEQFIKANPDRQAFINAVTAPADAAAADAAMPPSVHDAREKAAAPTTPLNLPEGTESMLGRDVRAGDLVYRRFGGPNSDRTQTRPDVVTRVAQEPDGGLRLALASADGNGGGTDHIDTGDLDRAMFAKVTDPKQIAAARKRVRGNSHGPAQPVGEAPEQIAPHAVNDSYPAAVKLGDLQEGQPVRVRATSQPGNNLAAYQSISNPQAGMVEGRVANLQHNAGRHTDTTRFDVVDGNGDKVGSVSAFPNTWAATTGEYAPNYGPDAAGHPASPGSTAAGADRQLAGDATSKATSLREGLDTSVPESADENADSRIDEALAHADAGRYADAAKAMKSAATTSGLSPEKAQQAASIAATFRAADRAQKQARAERTPATAGERNAARAADSSLTAASSKRTDEGSRIVDALGRAARTREPRYVVRNGDHYAISNEDVPGTTRTLVAPDGAVTRLAADDATPAVQMPDERVSQLLDQHLTPAATAEQVPAPTAAPAATAATDTAATAPEAPATGPAEQLGAPASAAPASVEPVGTAAAPVPAEPAPAGEAAAPTADTADTVPADSETVPQSTPGAEPAETAPAAATSGDGGASAAAGEPGPAGQQPELTGTAPAAPMQTALPIEAEQPAQAEQQSVEQPEVGGNPAQWVTAASLTPGDAARVSGFTDQGEAATVAGYVTGPATVTDSPTGRGGQVLAVPLSTDPAGEDATTVYTTPDALAARADGVTPGADGAPPSLSQIDAHDGLPEKMPADSYGNGVFPGSTVNSGQYTGGVVTGVSGENATVAWPGGGGGSVDTGQLHVTNQKRPQGWTCDGVLVRDGQIVRTNAGVIGTVDSVSGDQVAISGHQGDTTASAGDLSVIGQVAAPTQGAVQAPTGALGVPATAAADATEAAGEAAQTVGPEVAAAVTAVFDQNLQDTARQVLDALGPIPDRPTPGQIDNMVRTLTAQAAQVNPARAQQIAQHIGAAGTPGAVARIATLLGRVAARIGQLVQQLIAAWRGSGLRAALARLFQRIRAALPEWAEVAEVLRMARRG